MTFQKLLIGASMAIGVSALATAPAHALSFEFNNTKEINTYTGGSSATFIKGDAQGGTDAAIKALTDNDPTSNVELWSSDENPTSNVGFTTTVDGKSVTVSSITKDDWKIFGSQWLDGFLQAHSTRGITVNGDKVTVGSTTISKAGLLSSLLSTGLPSSGDPNIGTFAYDASTSQLTLDIIGHKDLKPRLDIKLQNRYATGNSVWDGMLTGAALQMTSIQASEIAKVTVGTGNDVQTYFAYSFDAIATGITASDDKESYSGKYTWSQKLPTAVPEPSVMLGLLGVAGVFASQRKFNESRKSPPSMYS
ncbi:NF038130 family PEP-CTERM protein [Nostoc sphaeroides CHAB 2801]|uniref:NF038130 family PEP-CTERM protein n=1 Tax=Nostoc sphaeroides TaxID=446679 RepID=UPI001E51639E|nr:NF038130 family PEP-CTERM protein [Nostoc sphaeroides]MCC5629962.1 NF038130 family PEP-CTERM protein [Nostoc sphaeroides CHAB 2801]